MLDSGQRDPRGEGGFTLPELLVAGLLAFIVIGAGVATFTTGIRGEPRARDRAGQIQAARTTMERISRELRQGYGVPTATPSELAILTYVKRGACGSTTAGPAIPCRVIYSCDAGTCTRTERNPDGSGVATPVQVVEGLTSDSVFGYSPPTGDPTYVGIRLAFPAREGDDAITLEDGVTLRNPPLGGA